MEESLNLKTIQIVGTESVFGSNTARITHPTRYAIVQIQRVIDQPSVPGLAPPRPVIDEEEPVVSAIMVRILVQDGLDRH